MDDWNDLRNEIMVCQRCALADSRTQAVPGEGPKETKLVIIGEAPGRQEDQQGRPFVGAAGQLLTQLLEGSGIKRASVFITNVVKCRPPDNRQPSIEERKACFSYLERQLAIIRPQVIALIGRVPAETLLDTSVRMGTMHGKSFKQGGRNFFVMYHPAAGLYNQNLIPVMEEDMEKLKELLKNKEEQTSQSEKGQTLLRNFFNQADG